MDDLIKPSFQTRAYHTKDVIRCRDRYQQYVWLREGIYPLDMYESRGDVIMVFPKNDETKTLYERWRNHEL